MKSLLTFPVVLMVFATPGAHAGQVSGDACDLKAKTGMTVPAPCKGLKFLTVTQEVPAVGAVVDNPDPKCSDEPKAEGYASAVLKVVAAYYTKDKANLARLSANLYDLAAKDFNKGLTDAAHKVPGDVGNFMRRNMQERTSKGVCAVILAAVPSVAKVVGYRFTSNDSTDGRIGPCDVGQDCRWARFLTGPQKTTEHGLIAYSALYINWSDNRSRTAEMTLFYRLPTGYRELHSM